VRLRCRGSLPEAVTYGIGLRRQQPHLFEYADAFVAVSEATARRLEWLGLPAGRTAVLPNFVRDGALVARSRAHEGAYALVSGRLVPEKGFDTAIAAATAAAVPLVIAGEGPDEARLRRLAVGAEVGFTGRLSESELADVRTGAAVTLMPSRWDEPCPYAVLDSLAAGVPVLVTDRGGLPELAGPSAVLPAADVNAWAGAVAELWADPPGRRRRGEAALKRARERFGEARYYERLMSVYG
jgi:glycosyltransferase involved in cell wall biosynthesis